MQRSIIETAVQSAFSVEFAATMIDANAQKKWMLSPEQVEELKTPAALYAKALGMQSLTARIEQYIRETAKRGLGDLLWNRRGASAAGWAHWVGDRRSSPDAVGADVAHPWQAADRAGVAGRTQTRRSEGVGPRRRRRGHDPEPPR